MEAKIEKFQAKRRRVPVPAQVAIVWVVVYLFLKLAINPPLPSSLIFMYMFLTSVWLLIYISVYEEMLQGFKGPVVDFLRGDPVRAWPWRAARWGLLVTISVYAGNLVYQRVVPQFEPPFAPRVIHPAPPPEVMGLVNPLRQQPDKLGEYIAAGARVYFSNCVFCHGDRFDGKGHFAHGFNPPPANFADPGTIAQLQESYVFWRISTGGPGLPEESSPWDSAMPKWSTMLNEEERWEVVLYLYHQTGWKPRTWE